MRDNTFTPGPWEYSKDRDTHDYCIHIKNPNKKPNGDIDEKSGIVGSSEWIWLRDEDARLIAAAPDMYDALWEAIELSDRNLTEAGRTPECQRVYDIVRAALRKAEGE